MNGEKDDTIVRTRKRGPFTRAVRVDTGTYSQIIALGTTMNTDAARVVKAAVAALFAGYFIRPKRVAHSTNNRSGPTPISQIHFPKPRPDNRYEEGTE